MSRRALLHRLPVVVAIAGLALVEPAQAQYFGRNKVQYREFTFQVLHTEHFDVHFYADEADAARDVARMAERWNVRLSQILRHSLDGRQPIVLYASTPDFQQTNVVSGEIGEGTGGVTEGLKRRVVLPLTGALAETDHVLGHELVHAFQYDMADRPGEDEQRGALIERLPLWFVEGMAEYLSLGPVDSHTAMWVRDAARVGKLPEIGQLNDPRYFPYRWGQALWAYIGGRWGDQVVRDIFDVALQLGPDGAFERVLGIKRKELSAAWHESIHAQYDPVIENVHAPSAYGRALVSDRKGVRPLYASPALSPDGRRIAFFSERGLLSVDLYVADVESGRIVRKLVNTAADPHFSTLQFINSAGAWRPTGQQFVVGAVRAGQPVLAIFDVESGDTVREIPFPGLGEILNPAWSPDGHAIAFSAALAGSSDLFVYDLASATLRRLTHDGFADLQPAWSPDGRWLAFVSDRFTTGLEGLHAGEYGLARLETATGRIEWIHTFDRGRSLNPQWTPDGGAIYFVADPEGVSNIYTLDVLSGDIRQITDVNTGVSGVTALSPSMSAAADRRVLAFSVYDQGHLTIRVDTDPITLLGTAVHPSGNRRAAATLPPATRASAELEALLTDAALGLPADTGTQTPYRARLSLDAVGQPYVTAGFDRFGPAFGGGIAALWSDMLGNHNLGGGVQINTAGVGFSDIYKDAGGVIAYQNLTHRWDWGLSAEQSPYLAGGYASGVTQVNGQPVYVDQEIIQRQIFRGLGATIAHPFSTARRVEFGSSYQHVSFEQEVRTRLTTPTGFVLDQETTRTSLAEPLALGVFAAAVVSDTAAFGATSPVSGQRSRFEINPTLGTITFTGALADYRRYVMPAPFYTLAARVMHYGRYGSSGEDPRLVPLSVGYPDLVRGYDIGSFSYAECTPAAAGTCAEIDRLHGSRLLVANLEFRFPLLRPFGMTGQMYGPVPTEIALFTDWGTAWSAGDRPTLFGGDRHPVRSAGVTFRVNLFGFAVAQMDVTHPFDRRNGLVWGFSFTPGF